MVWIEHIITGLFVIGLCLVAYGYWIEPRHFELTYHKVHHQAINKAFIRIVHITDVHLGDHMPLQRFDKIIQLINAQNPDLVVLTGDLLDVARRYKAMDKVGPALSKIEAPLGKFAVYGNHEYAGGGVLHYPNLLKEGHFKLLVNASYDITSHKGQVTLHGADCAMFGTHSPTFVEAINPQTFNILLLHQPDAITYYYKAPIDLALSGHTHNGQVRFPILGSLILPDLGKRFVTDWVTHPNKRQTKHYINRGLGMSMLPFRFGSRPEIAVIDLVPETPNAKQ